MEVGIQKASGRHSLLDGRSHPGCG